jgi:hypothetical protein
MLPFSFLKLLIHLLLLLCPPSLDFQILLPDQIPKQDMNVLYNKDTAFGFVFL